MQTTFSDAIINISVTGGVVRLEFAVAHNVPGEDGKPKAELRPTQQIVMPLEGFLRSVQVQQGIVQELIKQGALKPSAATPQPETAH